MAPKRDGFLAKTLSLTAVGEDTPPSQVLREKIQASAVSEVTGPCKSVMDLFQPFTHDGSVSLSKLHTNQDLDRHWSLTVSIAE